VGPERSDSRRRGRWSSPTRGRWFASVPRGTETRFRLFAFNHCVRPLQPHHSGLNFRVVEISRRTVLVLRDRAELFCSELTRGRELFPGGYADELCPNMDQQDYEQDGRRRSMGPRPQRLDRIVVRESCRVCGTRIIGVARFGQAVNVMSFFTSHDFNARRHDDCTILTVSSNPKPLGESSIVHRGELIKATDRAL
jgi:hypothetical protein